MRTPTLIGNSRCPLLRSIFNGAGIVGTELGAGLTALFGVTETNFDNLAALVIFCNLSSLAPLLAIGWLDEVTNAKNDQVNAYDAREMLEQSNDGIKALATPDADFESLETNSREK